MAGSSGLRQRQLANDFQNCCGTVILKNNLAAFTEMGLNFDGFKSGGPHEEQLQVATRNLGTVSAVHI
jgi:hypothetical protein